MFRVPTSILEINSFTDDELTQFIKAKAGRDRCRSRRGRVDNAKRLFKLMKTDEGTHVL